MSSQSETCFLVAFITLCLAVGSFQQGSSAQTSSINGTVVTTNSSSSNATGGQSSSSTSGTWSNGTSSGQFSNSSSNSWNNSTSGGVSTNSSTSQTSSNSSSQTSGTLPGGGTSTSTSNQSTSSLTNQTSSTSQSSSNSTSHSSSNFTNQSSSNSTSQSSSNSTSQSSSNSSSQSSSNSTSQSSSSSTSQTSSNSTSQSSSNSTSQSSNNSTGQSSSNSTSQSSSNSTSQTSSNSTSQSSSNSTSQTSSNSTNQSSSNSTSQSSNSTSNSSSNSSEWWNASYWWYAYTYFREDTNWSVSKWISYFQQAKSQGDSNSKWNFTEWQRIAYSIGEFSCSTESFIEVQSAFIVTLFEAIFLNPDERGDACISLKASIKQAKTLLLECEHAREQDWQSFSEQATLIYIMSARISEYKTTYLLVCSADEYDGSNENEDNDIKTCDQDTLMYNILGYLRQESMKGEYCSEASQAMNSIQVAQQTCPWLISSSLSLIMSQFRGSWLILCTPPTCNIPYVEITLSGAQSGLEEIEEHNITLSQSDKDNMCKNMKYVLAISMNHTIDCPASTYSSVSKKIDSVKTEYVKICGDIQEPKPCMKPDYEKITWDLGRSFFIDRSTFCSIIQPYGTSKDESHNYCNGNAPSVDILEDILTDCLFYSNILNKSICSRTSCELPEEPLECLEKNKIPDFLIEKLEVFIDYMSKFLPENGIFEDSIVQHSFMNLGNSCIKIILSGETDPSFCGNVDADIMTVSGSDLALKKNLTELISLFCPTTAQNSGCDINGLNECFRVAQSIQSGDNNDKNLHQCVMDTTATCSKLVREEGTMTINILTTSGVFAASNDSSSDSCVCDPAAAVNCIMGVHHEAKQVIPDWKGLCPLVPESETCARSYIEGCDDCKKSTVLQIVHKLNSQLEETCEDPPESECAAISAMKCVTELSHFQETSSNFSNDTTCIKITLARQCTYDRLEKCDEETTLAVTMKLEQVIGKWKSLQCQSPENQLEQCTDIFKTRIYSVLGISMMDMWNLLDKNDSTLFNKFTGYCEEAEFAFSCMNATLSLQGNETDAVIVRRTFEALYKSVIKVCEISGEPLQCYSCQGNGANSCVHANATETCHDKEICETVTSGNQGNSTVKSRGCKPRTACKPGCNKNGCSYCCSDNLCNNLDDGPVEGICNLTAVTACIMDLNADYIKTGHFECSKLEVAMECVKKEQAKCELGGMAFALDSLIKIDLSAEIHKCLLKEADKPCDVLPFAATSSYISQVANFQNKSKLCGIVAAARSKVAYAKTVCTNEEYEIIEESEISIEASIGYLDCQIEANFTIDIKCKPIDSLICVKSIAGSDKPKSLECKQYTDIVTCMKTNLTECDSAPEVFLVQTQTDFLQTLLPANANCTDVKLVDNPNITQTEMAECLRLFSTNLNTNSIIEIYDALMAFQTCIYDINDDFFLIQSVRYQQIMKFMTLVIEYFFQKNTEILVQLPVNLTETCSSGLNAVFYNHVKTLFGIPYLSLNQRDESCRQLDEDIMTVTSNCDMKATSQIFTFLDDLRDNFFTGYCPDIKPIERCAITIAEECFEEFTAALGSTNDSDMCLEASNFVDCAISYTKSCPYDELKSFNQKATLAVDYVTQGCLDNPELIVRARCNMLGRVDAVPGCVPPAISDCNKTPSSDCRDTEVKAACYTEKAGTCSSSIPNNDLSVSLAEIMQCRFGNESKTPDISWITTPCSRFDSSSCDITAAKNCLDNSLNQIDSGTHHRQIKQCLETHFNCIATIAILISSDITRYGIYATYMLEITPSWLQLESSFLIQWLKLSSYISDFMAKARFTAMDLVEQCMKLDVVFDQIEAIEESYTDEEIPVTETIMGAIQTIISDTCNDPDQILLDIEVPPDAQENPSCPISLVTAYVNILMSRAITDDYVVTTSNITGPSICSLYATVNQSIEASAEAIFSLKDCSQVFLAKVKFAMKIVHTILGSKCEVPDYEVKHCDKNKVEQCVSKLYQNLMSLGQNQTNPGFCMVYEETKACVEKYSFKCKPCTMKSIKYMFNSVSETADLKCMNPSPDQECDNEMEEEPNTCDIKKAIRCSVKPMGEIGKPYISNGVKCRHLHENLDCIQKATGGCTATLPSLIKKGAEKVQNFLSNKICQGVDTNVSNSGCQPGCWISKAYNCIHVFNSKVTINMQSSISQTTCQYINELNMCVTEHTESCAGDESKEVLQSVDLILEKIPGREETCIDVHQCSKDFDDLVRQIANLQESSMENDKDDDDHGSGGEDDDDDDDDNDDEGEDEDDDEDEDQDSSRNVPTLNSLCVRVKKSWTCMQNALLLLPEEKQRILSPLYDVIWDSVEEICSDTMELECYTCKNADSSQDCEKITETCPANKKTCMFKQILTGNGIKYHAGCSGVKKCPKNDDSKHTYYCTGDKCNTKSNTSLPCEFEKETCQMDQSLQCALKFSLHYINSDTINCSDASLSLGCIMKNANDCSNSKNLLETVSKIFLNIATSSCVINPAENCTSLAISSLRAALGSPTSTEGNSVCLALEQTTVSVNSLIASASCTEDAKISIKVVFSFLASIIGNYCSKDDTCPAEALIDYPKKEPHCSGHYLDGFRTVYKGYDELAKNESERDCGHCANYAFKARQYLNNCNLPSVIGGHLNALDVQLKDKCKVPDQTTPATVCMTLCQSSVILEYIDEVSAAIKDNEDLVIWYLNKVQTDFITFTAGCTSVQQKDVVNYIHLKLGNYIKMSQQKYIDFSFDLPLKHDIYYNAVMCSMVFQSELEIAFYKNDQNATCQAIHKMKNCSSEVPDLLKTFITGFTMEILEHFEDQNICGDMDRRRKDTATCQLERLSTVISVLVASTDIILVVFNSRKHQCLNFWQNLQEADDLVTECGDGLSQFQRKFYEITKVKVAAKTEHMCPALQYQEANCDFKKMAQCRKDFEDLSSFATVETSALCRRARFALECSARFSKNCTNETDITTALTIQTTFRTVIQQILGNSCPELTLILYCNGSVTDTKTACQMDEAETCRKNMAFDFTRTDEPGYCQALQKNVTCVQNAVSGCQSDQVTSLAWPKSARNGMCGISDASLDNVCLSVPACSSKPILDCFHKVDTNSCSSLQLAADCMNKYLSSNKQCQQSPGFAFVHHYIKMFYSTAYLTCNMTINATIPQPYANACLAVLELTVYTVLSIPKNNTAEETLYFIYDVLNTCLKNVSEGYSPITEMMEAILVKIQFSSVLITYINTDAIYKDTDKCFYTRAVSCLAAQIIRVPMFMLVTPDEKNDLCDIWSGDPIETCVRDAMSGCPKEHAQKFQELYALSAKPITDQQFCEQPQLCVTSEAYECVKELGTMVNNYEHDNDSQALCIGRLKSEECMDSYLSKCSDDVAKPVRNQFKELNDNLEETCKDVEIPKPPICPNIRERNRVCYLGNAYLCLGRFNTRMLEEGDTVIWRQQCLEIQKTIVCTALNTTACDPEDEIVLSIQSVMDDFKELVGYRCPWLTEDFCSIEPPCDVMTSGCDVELEMDLNNRESSVCEIKKKADACIAKNTEKCTQAQVIQARNVIDKKMASLGLPKDLSCQNGSIDGCLFSFLSSAVTSYTQNGKQDACTLLTSQYSCIVGGFSNSNHSKYLDLAMTLIDRVNTLITASQCTAPTSQTCTHPLPIRKVSTLITQLALNSNLSVTSFCAKSQAIFLEKKSNDCNAALYDDIMNSEAYQMNCANPDISCSDALVKTKSCISENGDFASLSCSDKQKAALCFTQFLPAKCGFDRSLLNGDLCEDTVILQVSGDQGINNFVSECGLPLKVDYELVGGSNLFKLRMTSRAVDETLVPSCLTGSKVNEPIPQIYTGMNPQRLQNNSNSFSFEIRGTHDYRTDGSQQVIVEFKVIPLSVTTGDNGQIVETELSDKAWTLSTFQVQVEDCDQPNSVCSSINDPHITTFDRMKYNNMKTGKYIMYKHTSQSALVVVEFYQCETYGTCNCGLEIFSEGAVVSISRCSSSQNSNFMTYKSAPGKDVAVNQPIAVYSSDNFQTYNFLIKRNGLIITLLDEYQNMQINIQPSSLDFENILGLCGNYDGNGYNDFQLPDGSFYKLTTNDTTYGIITPDTFNEAWKILNTDADSLKALMAAEDTTNTADDDTYCFDWGNTSGCSDTAYLATCGFIKGDDQTTYLLSAMKQDMTTQSKRRKKRQVDESKVDKPQPPTPRENLGWPTTTGITLNNATDYCMDNIYNKPLEACRKAVISLNDIFINLDLSALVQLCVDDIRLTGDTRWIDGTRIAATQLCTKMLNQNPQFQSNSNSSDLAIAFLDMTCIPYDCNGHGQCYRGQCICDKNYVGAKCDIPINDLMPPVLISADEVYLCQIGLYSDCGAVYIRGNNFVGSSMLSCHVVEMEVSETGIKDLTTGEVTIVKGQLITSNQVRCDLSGKNYMKRSVKVSVSNDGKLAYENYQTFIAYDPMCYDCDFDSCKQKRNVCIIGNRCVPEGDSSLYNECQYCSMTNPNDWSIRLNIPGCEKMLPKEDPGKQTLTTALIAVGCSLGAIIIILVTVCVIMRRRDAKKRRDAAIRMNEFYNHGYHSDMPFNGQPVMAYKPRQRADLLNPPRYQESP